MTHEFFFLTREDCYAWLMAIGNPRIQFVPAGTHETLPTVLTLKDLLVLSLREPAFGIGNTYLVSDTTIQKKVVPKTRGAGCYFVFDRTV
jgi:hypothetical protein